MNDISVFIYLMCFAAVFGMTCVYMFMMMRSTISEFDKRTVKTNEDVKRAYRMPAPHPEMEGINMVKNCWYSIQKMKKMMMKMMVIS